MTYRLPILVAQPVRRGSLAIVTRQAPTSRQWPVWLLPPRKTLCLLTIPNLFSGLLKYHSAEGLSSPATVVTVFCHLLSVSPHPHLLREEVGHEALEPDILVLHSGSVIHYLYDFGKVTSPVFASVSLYVKR